MKKLLILLSVVLFISLCQARPTTNVHTIRPLIIQPLNCTFGFKKVNGTKRCKTMTEFFQHPRNETNCTKLQKLKCYNYKNATACLCIIKRPIPPHSPLVHICGPGLVYRCRGKNNCFCDRFNPNQLNAASRVPRRCNKGEILLCPNGFCSCKKIKRNPLPEPLEPIEPLKPLEPMKPMEPFEPMEPIMPLV